MVRGSWTLGLVHARQMHYHWAVSPALSFFFWSQFMLYLPVDLYLVMEAGKTIVEWWTASPWCLSQVQLYTQVNHRSLRPGTDFVTLFPLDDTQCLRCFKNLLSKQMNVQKPWLFFHRSFYIIKEISENIFKLTFLLQGWNSAIGKVDVKM